MANLLKYVSYQKSMNLQEMLPENTDQDVKHDFDEISVIIWLKKVL